jgi:polyferredoxin
MFQSGVVVVLLVSFGLFEMVGPLERPSGGASALAHRFDLVPAGSRRHRLLLWPPLRFLLQLPVVALFALIIAAGLFGNQNPAFNIAPMLTWTLWWAGLIFFVLYFGKLWCTVCPWDAVATWMERLRPWGARGRGLGLRLPWPKALRNIWLAVAFFVVLTWIELGQGVTSIPRMTAVLALTMLAMTVMGAFLFDRKSFCRYGCLVGRVSGLYALFSPLELRTRDKAGCAGCATRECFVGSARGDGCPTFEYPRSMDRSTYCTLCTECVRTCPRDNVTLRLRPWGADLAGGGPARKDEAVLAIVLLSMTGFHGLTMIPSWPRWLQAVAEALRVSPPVAFTLVTAGMLLAPILLFGILSRVSAWTAKRDTRTVFLNYAYALLPIALFYHLAHTAEHFLMEGPKVLALASDPFGTGWDLFGTARAVFPPLVTLEGLWVLQVLFVVVGHLYGLWISAQTTRRLVADPGRAAAAQLPMLATMILSSLASLWLLSQPMEMRLSAM